MAGKGRVTEPKHFRFLDLPPELRREVYNHVLETDAKGHPVLHRSYRGKVELVRQGRRDGARRTCSVELKEGCKRTEFSPLALASGLIANEIRSLAWEFTEFSFDRRHDFLDIPSALPSPAGIPQSLLPHLRYLKVELYKLCNNPTIIKSWHTGGSEDLLAILQGSMGTALNQLTMSEDMMGGFDEEEDFESTLVGWLSMCRALPNVPNLVLELYWQAIPPEYPNLVHALDHFSARESGNDSIGPPIDMGGHTGRFRYLRGV